MTGLFHCTARAMASSVAVSQACKLKTISGEVWGVNSAMLAMWNVKLDQPSFCARSRHLEIRDALRSMPMKRAGMFWMLFK